MNQLRFDIRFILATPLHTTGTRVVWGVDKATAQGPDGQWMVPATSLKGLLRSSAEAILRAWGMWVCEAPLPGSMCADATNLCVPCRVFGNARLVAPLKFRDAKPPINTPILEVRSGVTLSRHRRAALAQRLFFVETVATPPDREWVSSASGEFSSPSAALEAAALLTLATRYGYAMGSSRTRGLGWVERWYTEVHLDGQHVVEDELARYWCLWAQGGIT